MLLAAGRGERLRPLTDTTPKPLIEVAGKTLLDYHLEKLSAAGVSEIIINTSWLSEKIHRHIERSDYPSIKFHLSHEPQALETAGGVRKVLSLLGDEPFLLISADIWSDLDYRILSTMELGTAQAQLLMVDNPAHNPDGDFEVVDHRVTTGTRNKLTYSGMGVFHTDLFRQTSSDQDVRGDDTRKVALREVLDNAIENDLIAGTQIQCKWFDVGTVDRLKALESYVINGKA